MILLLPYGPYEKSMNKSTSFFFPIIRLSSFTCCKSKVMAFYYFLFLSTYFLQFKVSLSEEIGQQNPRSNSNGTCLKLVI